MARAWADSVEGDLETPFGVMRYTITEWEHVYLSAGGSDRLPPLVVNRVPYHVSLHLFLQPDKTWVQKDWHDLHMSRKDSMGDASRAARDKAYEGIREAWEEFIAGNAALLPEAERRHLNNEIRGKEEEVEKAQAALRSLETDLSDLLRREEDLG